MRLSPNFVFQHHVGAEASHSHYSNDLFQHGKLEEIEKAVRATLTSDATPRDKVPIELSKVKTMNFF